ncbi:MAG: protein-L-isoaspartate(D-aspartate) O-methyltransferase [Deltaproteobacteria bacterium]|nr:protein-L-isoaspartate(D-aspartate) O-methyltransferase [Deltaproteobacteria bacterium]
MKEKSIILMIIFILFFMISFISSAVYGNEDIFKTLRHKMIEKDIKARGINNPRVLAAMEKVPRHLFVPKNMMKHAYEDRPLPIGHGQTISQPYIVALMTQLLDVKPGEKVLEIGTGSGYQAAVLAELTDKVYTIEILEPLAKEAEKRLNKLGYDNVKVKVGDGFFGWKEYAPFDAIIITCAAPKVPPKLVEQLKDGGRILLPLGENLFYQNLTLVTKKNGKLKYKYLSGVVFVPMTGKIREEKEK